MSVHIPKTMENSHQIWCFLGRMVLEWHECEHEDVDRDVQGDMVVQQALRACGLYKFWHLGSLRDKPRLLQMLIDYWDPNTEAFQLDGISLRVKTRGRGCILHHWTIPTRQGSEIEG